MLNMGERQYIDLKTWFERMREKLTVTNLRCLFVEKI